MDPNSTKLIDETNPSNSFVVALASMDYGNLIPDASGRLSNLVAEVVSTGRKGSLTLTITIAPAKGEKRLKVESELTVKRPKPEKGESLFFGTELGQLLRHDPRQKEMEFGDAPRVVRPAAVNE